MRLCITGSRTYPHLDFVKYWVWTMIPYISVVLCGMCPRGVDLAVAQVCQKHSIDLLPFVADWDTYKHAAGPRRNTRMVYKASDVVAFWDGKSRGTMNTIGTARQQGKLRAVYNSDMKRVWS